MKAVKFCGYTQNNYHINTLKCTSLCSVFTFNEIVLFISILFSLLWLSKMVSKAFFSPSLWLHDYLLLMHLFGAHFSLTFVCWLLFVLCLQSQLEVCSFVAVRCLCSSNCYVSIADLFIGFVLWVLLTSVRRTCLHVLIVWFPCLYSTDLFVSHRRFWFSF